MKPFSSVATALVATVLCASAQADTTPNLAGLLDALLGAVVTSTANVNAPKGDQQVAPQGQSVTQMRRGKLGPSAEQQTGYVEIAKQIYVEKQSDINYTDYQACREAAGRFVDPFYLNTNQCSDAVKPLRETRLAENAAALERSRVTKKVADDKAVDAIVARAAAGDAGAISDCQWEPSKDGQRSERESGAANACGKRVMESRDSGLRSKTITPASCRDWGVANGYDKSKLDASAVSLQRSSDVGVFGGQVTQIDGENIVVYNPISRSNSIINVSGSKVFGGGSIIVGSGIAGYGVQTGSSQGRLVSGQGSTFAKISSKCIGGI